MQTRYGQPVVTVTVRIPISTHRALQDAACGRPLQDVAAEAIEEYLALHHIRRRPDGIDQRPT